MPASVLTPEVRDTIVSAVAASSSFADAAQYAGIGRSTHYQWMARGERELARLEAHPRARPKQREQLYADYVDAVKRAEARAKVRNVTIIADAAPRSWQAAAWLLERRYPREYAAPAVRLLHGFDAEAPLAVEVSHRDALADELAALADRIAPAALGAGSPDGPTHPSPLEEVFDLGPHQIPT